ncbi:hypothetical protein SETIT_8G175600v2 [Setaria italica]|uniref:Uncharacterized protein n=1 Tax=Setaria italica TaxID=4555 RepID=A0A368S8T8_SETIT|nr:hypothetical protein SETIT_8G175600v2 [Setaria italica]
MSCRAGEAAQPRRRRRTVFPFQRRWRTGEHATAAGGGRPEEKPIRPRGFFANNRDPFVSYRGYVQIGQGVMQILCLACRRAAAGGGRSCCRRRPPIVPPPCFQPLPSVAFLRIPPRRRGLCPGQATNTGSSSPPQCQSPPVPRRRRLPWGSSARAEVGARGRGLGRQPNSGPPLLRLSGCWLGASHSI